MSTLAESWKTLLAEVGDFMGYGMDTAEYDADQTARAEKITREGIRRVQKPTPFYAWTFLRPTITLTLASGESSVTVGPDVRHVVSPKVAVFDANSGAHESIPMVSVPQIDELYATHINQTGPPRCAALRAIKAMGSGADRKDLYVFPTADQAYTLKPQVLIWQDRIDGTHPWPHGMPEHASLYVASVLAVAEEVRDGAPGVNAATFQRELSSSIMSDRQRQGSMLGLGVVDGRSGEERTADPVPIDGVLYS